MRRIGDKPPALLLRDLEPSRQLVKLLSQLRQLIVSIHGDPMGVLPGPHRADSPQEGPDPPGKERGKGPKQNQYRQADHHGDQPQVPLQLLQQCPLVTVLVIQTDRPHHLVSIHHRGGGPSWYSLEKASLPRRAETTSPMRAYFPRAEGSPVS